jgi:integrase
MAVRKFHLLTDRLIEARIEFETQGIFWDSRVHGLNVRVGKRRVTWTFYREHRLRGKRGYTCRRLGFFPVMTCADARKAAEKVATARPQPGRKDAMTFAAAMVEYDQHLHAQSKRRGKEPTWARIVQSFARKHLLPEFGNWTLAELSAAPAVVRDFHRDVTKDSGPIAANHCARILVACYKNAAKLDRSLPPELPTSAVQYNPEKPSTAGLPFADFPKWKAALDKIESPIRHSYFLTALLTGCRPGELARLRREDIMPKERAFVIRGGKSGDDIRIVLSVPIVRALRRALGAHDGAPVFPGCQWPLPTDKLPATGRALRRTYRTVAADLGVNEVLTRLLMGHSLAGINQRYITELVLQSGPGLRTAQVAISRRIVTLLGQP